QIAPSNSSGNTLYGTAQLGGNNLRGAIFDINTDDTGITNLHSIAAIPIFPGPYTNSDATHPLAGLILSGSTLYGTASGGGTFGHGTIFKINTDGTGFTNLHIFTPTPGWVNSDGAYPYAELTLAGNTLYGTASQGGNNGNGTVFKLNTD